MTKINTQDLGENIVKELKSIFDPEAYEYYLKGKYLYENMSSNNDKVSTNLFLK